MTAHFSEFLHQLRAAVDGPGFLTQSDDLSGYEQGARYGHGQALCVIRPKNNTQLQAIVRLCFAHGVNIIPQGANTGLVGASTPDASGAQIVVSTARLRETLIVDAANRSVTVAAGITLKELNEALAEHGLWFPVDLGANPSIGGMIAANTGGTRLVRYGDVRHNLMALQCIPMTEEAPVLQWGRALRKNNTGYDFKQLLVGASGCGAIVTQATLEVHPIPAQSATAFVVPCNADAVLPLLLALERDLGDCLAAFEGISGNALRAAIDHVPSLRNPFEPESIPDYAILIELETSLRSNISGLYLEDALQRFLESQFEQTITNAVLGSSQELWDLRHSISEGARALGQPIAFDVSVARSRIMDFIRRASALVTDNYPFLHVVDFGHIADGGVHFNVIWKKDAVQAYDPVLVQQLRQSIYALAVEDFDGSFSAEHGIGPHNQLFYQKYTSTYDRQLAQALRVQIDPLQLCGNVNFGPSDSL